MSERTGNGRILIRGGRLIDPSLPSQMASDDYAPDILIEDGVIKSIGGTTSSDGARVIDAHGLIVAPGFIDLHTHLRDPGLEY